MDWVAGPDTKMKTSGIFSAHIQYHNTITRLNEIYSVCVITLVRRDLSALDVQRGKKSQPASGGDARPTENFNVA